MTAEGNVVRCFGELSEALGLHRAVAPDEHDRWIVYQQAFDRREARSALLAMVGLEPDHHVATGIVLEMIERVPQGDVAAWIDALLPGSSGERLARQRADDVATVRAVLTGVPLPVPSDIGRWSDWVQRRLAARADDGYVLSALAQFGRTRRVRALAASRLRAAPHDG